MKISLFAALMLLATTQASAQARAKADRDTDQWRYEIECVNQGIQGSYQVKVWSYSKKPHVALEQTKKNAVHGVVFKGYSSNERKCTEQKPLTRDPEAENTHVEFFRKFFDDGGDYMKYVSVSSDGTPGPGDIMKVGKEYKVGVIVSVSKDQLRKYLEDQKIVKGLSSGF
jgi:hypothetical protein